MKRPWHLIFIAMSFCFFATYMSKMYGNTHRMLYSFLAVAGYFVATLLWLPTIARWNNLAVVGTIWNVLYIIIDLFVALVCFREQLHATQIVGIGFGI